MEYKTVTPQKTCGISPSPSASPWTWVITKIFHLYLSLIRADQYHDFRWPASKSTFNGGNKTEQTIHFYDCLLHTQYS